MSRLRPLSIGLLLASLASSAGSGCSSTYDGRYRYRPRPVSVESAAPDASSDGAVVTLISVIGLRRADQALQLPASIEVRLRVENMTTRRVTLDPGTLSLVAGNLKAFPAPIVEPPGRLEVPSGAVADLTAFFPFPESRYPDGFELSGLNLRWTVDVDGRRHGHGVTFQRERYERTYYRYVGPRYEYGRFGGYYRGGRYDRHRHR